MRPDMQLKHTCALSFHMQFVPRKLVRMTGWSWYPTACSLAAFDGMRLSRKLAGREVLFIGDSLMFQQFEALRSLMCPTPGRCALSSKLDTEPLWEHFWTPHGAVFQFTVSRQAAA